MPHTLRVGILHNRFSGKGRGPDFVSRLRARVAGDTGLQERFDLVDLPLDLAMAEGALDTLDAVVLTGGDGTFHHALGALSRAKGGRGVPTLIAPLGTENVVAKELGLKPRVSTVLESLEAFRQGAATLRTDLGVVHHPDASAAGPQNVTTESVPFALMLTAGPDAAIVHRVAKARGSKTGGKMRFVLPTFGRALRPNVRRLSVAVDGQQLASNRRGCLIVAIGPRYPLRLDLARKASRTDGLLDVVFLPASTTASILGWLAIARLGLHIRHPQARYAQGRKVELTMHDHNTAKDSLEDLQIDGEIERVACDDTGRMVIESLPSAVPLIMPVALEARASAKPAMAGG
ncbi:MAG: diacylglycerol/lipid kinase family protein, partial [Phycisphaerales bacterium JB064]